MLKNDIVYERSDREAIRILDDFLPDRIFDAHAHIFDSRFMKGAFSESDAQRSVGLDEYRSAMLPMLSSPRELLVNMIPMPDASMGNTALDSLAISDEFLVRQLDKDERCVGEIMLRPGESESEIRSRLVHRGIKGFKCYHTLLDRNDSFNADIEEYLPEWAWQIANEKGMCITLHMVKERSLADEKNLDYIKAMAKKYPNAVLILAHAARAFAPWTALETVEKIAELENVWYDFSSVCEPTAIFWIIRKVGISRCMWGSDFPICIDRGKVISLADTFYWIYQSDLDRFFSKTGVNNWLIGIENLMAMRQAAQMLELTPKDVEALFFGNASGLWKI
ncbi:MAG: amidohydrolase family protein [Clostridia bacterium]|nr:amidohydrolase family protein [Clostridia bacterium]